MEGPGPASRRERRIPTFDAPDQLNSLGCSRYARKKVLSGNPHLDSAAELFEDDGLGVMQTHGGQWGSDWHLPGPPQAGRPPIVNLEDVHSLAGYSKCL